MTEHEQIKALAEMDGWKIYSPGDFNPTPRWQYGHTGLVRTTDDLPDYLTSSDAIIPLIQKRITSMCWPSFQDALGLICAETLSKSEGENHRYEGDGSYQEAWLIFQPTPAQLGEALLRATGKWKD